MKRIAITLMLLLLCAPIWGQGLQLVDANERIVGTVGAQLNAVIKVKNTSEAPIWLAVKRTGLEIQEGQSSYFCWEGDCMNEEVNTYFPIRWLAPGETTDAFNAVLEAGLNPTRSKVSYCFFDLYNKNSELCFTLNYEVREVASREILFHDSRLRVTNVYPNPVLEDAFLDYNVEGLGVEAKVVLRNVLGSVVGEYELPRYEAQLKIPAQNMEPGIYFYTLVVDQEVLATKKFLVRR